MTSLDSYSHNIHSQNGEDGIVSELLKRIDHVLQNPKTGGWVCEFGAWDGIYLSNALNLISNLGFSSVLIECDNAKFKELERNLSVYQNQFLLIEFILVEGPNNLDGLLARSPIPSDFDVLSIDIDGMDYYIWESLQNYRPKIVIIEFNPSMPSSIEYIQPKNFKVKQGSSPLSITKLAQNKGYFLVAATHCNLIFVEKEIGKAIGFANSLEIADAVPATDINNNFIFQGYDGTIILSSPEMKLLWHGLPISRNDVQVLPRFLRKYPNDYSIIQSVLYRLLRMFRK